jgi:hypothetical protein
LLSNPPGRGRGRGVVGGKGVMEGGLIIVIFNALRKTPNLKGSAAENFQTFVTRHRNDYAIYLERDRGDSPDFNHTEVHQL